MQVRFLSDSREQRSFGGGTFSHNRQSSGLFWWTILITFLMGLATFCWFFSIMVFANPEKPFSYKLLARFDKLEPLRKFSPYTVPQGPFRSARDLLEKYYPFSEEQLQVTNDLLKRGYIHNYREESPEYLKGEFTVLHARKLNVDDVFTSGWVIRARAADLEDVDTEIILPGLTSPEIAFNTGDKLMLDQRTTFASLLNVQRLDAERFCLTVVPLAYQCAAGGASKILSMDPPKRLNIEAVWPLTKELSPSAENAINQKVAIKAVP